MQVKASREQQRAKEEQRKRREAEQQAREQSDARAAEAKARIEAMREMPEGEDGVIAEAVDALFDQKRLPAELETRLAQAIGRQAVFDLIATVGFYSTLGYILMTYETPIDADIAG